MAQKIIIDADPGVVDALAVLTALAEPALDVVGVTAAAGTVSGVQATRNLQFLIGRADPVRHPRIGQSDIALAPGDQVPAEVPSQYVLNGRFGLGDVRPDIADLHNRRESARLIVDLAREFPEEVCLLTLGPLTNLAVAMELAPDLPRLVQRVVCLGGAMQCGGDVTAAAEFNFWADPAAARAFLHAPFRKLLVPLDVSQTATLAFEDVDRLTGLIPSTPPGELVNSLLHFAVLTNRQHLPRESIVLSAISALSVAAGLQSFQSELALVDVETGGSIAAGATFRDQRPTRVREANCHIVTAIDECELVDYFCRTIRRIAS